MARSQTPLGHARVALAVMLVLTVVLVILVNCGFSTSEGPALELAVPDGGVALSGSCSGDIYVSVPFSSDADPSEGCNFLLCYSTGCNRWDLRHYALCVDGAYSVCSCFRPPTGPYQGIWHEVLPDGALVVGNGLDCGAVEAR